MGEKVGKFFGTYYRSLDAKNRLQIPSKLIVELPESFYAIRGYDGCIAIYCEESFLNLTSKLEQMSFLSKKERDHIRLIASSVKELEVDSHGRITIDRDLLEKHKIEQDVVVVGVINHFEIWNRSLFDDYIAKVGDSFEETSEEIAKNG